MRIADFEENELILMAIFEEKTKEETIDALAEALENLKDLRQNPSDDEMLEIIASLIEKLQVIEERHYYDIDLTDYILEYEEEANEA